MFNFTEFKASLNLVHVQVSLRQEQKKKTIIAMLYYVREIGINMAETNL